MSHVREARMLCKKIVNFFSLLSHSHESGSRRMGITQDLLSLVTGLAHYLKILIRIALTAALKLEREYASKTALSNMLSRLDRLCAEAESSKSPTTSVQNDIQHGSDTRKASEALQHGYQSLVRPEGTITGQREAMTDLCDQCRQTIEDECIRFGKAFRWHLQCLSCSVCHRHASKDHQRSSGGEITRSPVIHFSNLGVELTALQQDVLRDDTKTRLREVRSIYCAECAAGHRQEQGFEYVTRLEQYAFLLYVALNKLYRLLGQQGAIIGSASRQCPPNLRVGPPDDPFYQQSTRKPHRICPILSAKSVQSMKRTAILRK